ncbi:Cytosolic carboxypeptidase 2 [Amphibalanus amphitrite]|uniref:Cytosolic carboxypeptidase 2 n=1 Tax=Amphibalanus amphitrite TaxID=1232801 RepID=A0A6A4X2Q9_AMPAM|nr:Cytosolic carboxypeptidase 2 [Amphibalanus amphitrite]
MTSRGLRPGRTRETAGGGRDAPKYLPPRWPSECQVVCEAFRHLSESPSEREQYYVAKGDEPTPPPVGHELGRVVFQYRPDETSRAFSRSCPERLLDPSAAEDDPSPPADEPDSVLQFESRFESGNLQEAVHVSGNYYELRMRNDLYTERHTQWFYFRVRNTRAGELYRWA